MSKVFILEPTTVDTSACKAHGKPMFVFGRGDRRPSVWEPAFSRAVLAALDTEGYDPNVDLFCVVGHIVSLTIAIAAITAKHRQFRALQWNAQSREYVIVYMGDTT